MKKIFIVVMAFAATVFTGCANEDMYYENIDNGITINFTVAEKAGFEDATRAVKSGWAVGDQIIIVFQKSDNYYLDCSNQQNTLKLTKTADGWNADTSNLPANTENLKNGKSFFAFHHPGDIVFGTMSGNIVYPTSYQKGLEYLYYQGTYTLSGNEISLSNIVMQRRNGSFQISVKNLANVDGDWRMALHNTSGFKLDEYYTKLYLYLTGSPSVSGTTTEEAYGVTINNDEVFNFIGRSTSNIARWISLTSSRGTYYYRLDSDKTISELGNKAWVLPELNINGSNQIVSGCKWSKTMD